jgi:hypothetical protein
MSVQKVGAGTLSGSEGAVSIATLAPVHCRDVSESRMRAFKQSKCTTKRLARPCSQFPRVTKGGKHAEERLAEGSYFPQN